MAISVATSTSKENFKHIGQCQTSISSQESCNLDASNVFF